MEAPEMFGKKKKTKKSGGHKKNRGAKGRGKLEKRGEWDGARKTQKRSVTESLK